MAEVGIKVSIRCRPFVQKDPLGVKMITLDDENGEVELLQTKYSTTRFGFSYSWWSAYGYQRYAENEGDMQICEEMELINQPTAYDRCGVKIMDDLLNGNAIVLFAYGLSGSGKTFTVFGPDSPDLPEAWFNQHDPHTLWGIFPRLAFSLFEKKKSVDGWRISVKYFQNVVETIRDLLSPLADEKNYKLGMKKDPDGFMDVDWCQSVILESWEDLTKLILQANTRKAIAPTQFNHQSTRGHCILVLTIEFPHPTMKGIKQKGRVYVCDLAGTEPAADIVYAQYERVSIGNEFEWKYIGPHRDQSKTKELQDQGKKINLSLSEMAQFFLKMATAVKSGKLKAGQSIPGCNTYFLCKFLKDTMLQARTYLFCAIRPELCFQKYTFATLQFAANASVIKLNPKMATTNQSKREMQLLEELERMRRTIEDLKTQKTIVQGPGASEDDIARLLQEKQDELRKELQGQQQREKTEEMQHQKQSLQERGIYISDSFENDPEVTGGKKLEAPYLINIAEDSFRDRRFIYLLVGEKTIFGSGKGDVRPMNLLIVNDHCAFKWKNEEVDLIRGKGEVFHNGNELEEKQKVRLKNFDRLVIGQEVLLFINPLVSTTSQPLSAKQILQEYYDGKNKHDEAYQKQAQKLQEEKEILAKELERMKKQGESEAVIRQKQKEAQLWKALDETMLQTLPLIKSIEQLCAIVNRNVLSFKLSLQQPKDEVPNVKIQIGYTPSGEQKLSDAIEVFLDPFELQTKLELFRDQVNSLKSAAAIERNFSYTIPIENDIITDLFDTTYQFASGTSFLLYCGLNLETDPEDVDLDLMKSVIPYNKVGELEVKWTPINHEEIMDPSELLGKPWKYTLKIERLKKLTTKICEAYIQYDFNGEKFTSETLECEGKREINFEYEAVHCVDEVTEEFLTYLDETELKFNIFIKPWIKVHEEPLSTGSRDLLDRLGILVLDEELWEVGSKDVESLKKENLKLRGLLEVKEKEIFELRIELEKESRILRQLKEAKQLDSHIQENLKS